MSGPPRRKSVPPAPPPSFDDERPTPIATAASAPTTTTTQTQTDMELAPEPPTILAISITAPTFKSSDQVPAARLPVAIPDVPVTGPFAKTHIREGEGRTVLDMPKVTPPGPAPSKVTAPSFSEAARSGPFARTNSRVGDSETVSERIQIPPGETTLPPGPSPVPLPAAKAAPPVPPPGARPAARSPAPDRKALDRKPTEVADPWEYAGDAPEQAAALSSDYESGGVELDPSGRLVAPGLKRRKRDTSEVSEISSPADLLSVGLDVWPDAPPPAAGPPPRVEPVADVAPEPPPEPDTAPRAPPPPRRGPPARVPSPRKPSVAHADTVLRAPRSQLDAEPEGDPEEQFFQEEPSESGVVTEDPSAGDPVPTPTPVRSNPRRLTSDEERYGLDEDYAPEGAAGPTNVNEPLEEEPAYDERFDDDRYAEDDDRYADDRDAGGDGYGDVDSTGRRVVAPPPLRREGSPWPRRLLLLALLGAGFGGAWLWATGQWEPLLRWFGLR